MYEAYPVTGIRKGTVSTVNRNGPPSDYPCIKGVPMRLPVNQREASVDRVESGAQSRRSFSHFQ